MYLDTAYIVKYYLNERDSPAVRRVITQAEALISSVWALAEVQCIFHRNMREAQISESHLHELSQAFSEHVASGLWTLVPVTEALLRRTAAKVQAAPNNVFLRAGDAVHLLTASEAGEREIWSNDRHMLAAASYFGLVGRSV